MSEVITGRPPKYTQKWLKKEADLFKKWMQKEESIYFKSFACQRGYSAQRLAEFAQVSEAFSAVYELAKDWQEQKLVNYGLFNKINAGLTKFVLQNHHNWAEKSQITSNTISDTLAEIAGKSKDLVNNEEMS